MMWVKQMSYHDPDEISSSLRTSISNVQELILKEAVSFSSHLIEKFSKYLQLFKHLNILFNRRMA